MPTLANLQGGSLVSSLDRALGTVEKTIAAKQAEIERQRVRDAEAAKQAKIAEQVERTIPQPGADPEAQRATEEAALIRLGALNPQIAKVTRDTLQAGDEEAKEVLRTQAEGGARNAAFIGKQPDFASQQRAIRKLANDAVARGEPLDRYIELQNLSEDELGLELQRMEIAAQDIKTVLTPQETFTPILDATGNIIAQKSSKTGRAVTDPRAPDAASKPGMASAVTKIFGNGTVVQALPNGRTAVIDPEGNEVTGDARLETLKAARSKEIEFERTKAGAKSAGAQAIAQSTKAFEQIGKIKTSIANIDRGIELIDEGAGTGPVLSRLPSIRSASIQLDNVQKAMGLDVIGTTTFGALSKGELDLALSKALPTNLAAPDLRDWMVSKKDSQEKLAAYLEDVAIYLGTEGNTVAGWLEAQRDISGAPVEEAVETITPQEGATATHPNTGEKVIFRGGQWQTQ